MKKLNDCPICTGKAELFHPTGVNNHWYAECYEAYNDYDCCEVRTKKYSTEDEATRAWNNRFFQNEQKARELWDSTFFPYKG